MKQRDAMDLMLIANQCRRNSERWFPDLHANKDLYVFYSLALAGEIGEVCNLVKKDIRNVGAKHDELGGELADVFTYLLLLADECHIDLIDELEKKQAICEARWG